MVKIEKNILLVPTEVLVNKIYVLRNEKIMLDKDLAKLYGVQPKRLREQVKRNFSKFPSHFMFQLNELEVEIVVSQKAIPSKQHLGGTFPFAFTEQGRSEYKRLFSGRILNGHRQRWTSRAHLKSVRTFSTPSGFSLNLNCESENSLRGTNKN